MKFSESWLREFVNPPLSRDELCAKLTHSGLEIEEQGPVAGNFSNVVLGNIISFVKHPEAERLHVCEVDIGQPQHLTIVCAATNVKANMHVAVALDGATLPNAVKVKTTPLRGVISQGMLCSAKELGLAEESDGLMEFHIDAPLGKSLREYLELEDYFIDVSITPNRGDCLSILGIAKEISALTESKLTEPKENKISETIKDELSVKVAAKEECPIYVGRVIKNVNAHAHTPIWLRERLRRSGHRSISPIVDITNYIMLELGQPMHAFSLDKISNEIQVRMARQSETITLLDESEIILEPETLLIADAEKPLAIAGVMGGLDSGVTSDTKDIFLESAFFSPRIVAKAARRYKLNSDSAYRFERGIDATLQRRAIERATELLLEIVGGEAGPVVEVKEEKYIPQPKPIILRPERLEKILGCHVQESDVENILKRLGFHCEKVKSQWEITIPARRSDITSEIDVIEEVIRLYGYDKIPCHNIKAALQIHPNLENQIPQQNLRRLLCSLGYQEVITYSFVEDKFQKQFSDKKSVPLLNPITADMDVMRTSLIPGLVNTLIYNQNRQQTRTRIFEMGLRFSIEDNVLLQERTLSGLINGSALPEQWSIEDRLVDFFDLKGDLQNLFSITLSGSDFTFKPTKNPMYHSGQGSDIFRADRFVGTMGAIHPSFVQSLKIDGKVFVFELSLDLLETARVPRYVPLSKFPEIRRDIAILVDQSVPAQEIQDTIRQMAGELLKDIDIFDLYQGKGIEPGFKSIALALTLQHASRTLVDEEVTELMERVIGALKGRFNAELRG